MRTVPGDFIVLELWKQRVLLVQLIKRDIKQRFAGSTLGVIWAFVQPIAMMSILWFVFSFGLKMHAVGSGGDVSFVAWFFPAQIAWTFFQEGVMAGSSGITDYAFLVKKVKFNTSLLPVVKVFAQMVFHAVFVLLTTIILCLNGIFPSGSWIFVPYFSLCLVVLLVSLGWLTAALTVFFRDVQQALAVLLQFGFWLTPIIWNASLLPENLRYLLKLNPIFYITEGYRSSFLGTVEQSFDIHQTTYFWLFVGLLFVLGQFVFRRLKPHFGDVL